MIGKSPASKSEPGTSSASSDRIPGDTESNEESPSSLRATPDEKPGMQSESVQHKERPEPSSGLVAEGTKTQLAGDSAENEAAAGEARDHEASASTTTLVALVVLVVVSLASVGFFVGRGPGLILVLAASALGTTIWLMWTSLQKIGTSDEMDFEEALSLAAPSATEEQKHAVLRALKDLEYERHVGKISEEDFKAVSADYRTRAKRLIAAQDENMRDRMAAAQKLVERRLNKECLLQSESQGARGDEE